MIESNKVRLYFLRHFCLFFGLVFIAGSILKFYNPEQTTDWEKLVGFSAIGVLLIVLNVVFYDVFKLVKIDTNKVIFDHPNNKKELKWSEVQKVNRVRFVSPPVYYIKIKSSGKIIVFPTESNYSHTKIETSFLEFIFDHSKMGDIIKKVKVDYDI